MIDLLFLSIAFAQSVIDATTAHTLEREFVSAEASYLLVSVKDGGVIAARWEDADCPVPLGSLVKPFTAIAYGERHGYRYPRLICHGERDHCWFPRGHGELGLEEAIAHSCNAWFQQLAERTEPAGVVSVLSRFGVHAPFPDVSPETLIGKGDTWKLSPLEMMRAYCELASRASDNSVKPLLRGMTLSARWGTAAELRAPALAKTGTAPCTHSKHNAVDGFVMALYPPEQPRYALLVRIHGVTGALAASRTGRFLRTMRKGL